MPESVGIRIIRLSVVERKVGVKKATIYRWMKEGLFPRPVSIGRRAVGWLENEIDEWILSRTRAL